jgi:hypothetical protein
MSNMDNIIKLYLDYKNNHIEYDLEDVITPFSLKNGTLKIYYFFLFFSIKSFA